MQPLTIKQLGDRNAAARLRCTGRGAA